ncbi:MAG: histidinol-phosphate transaminase [Proteobacteria bacterium]|nr:histidinol-phosphate transaminase [Pseudomonadota bacterium]
MKAYTGPRAPENLLALKPYVPGKPIEELEREYGVRDSIKLASNENPLGPSPKAREAVIQAVERLHRYPDGAAHELTAALAEKFSCDPEQIVLGNGSDEIIQMLAQAYLGPGDSAVMSDPAFLMYEISVQTQGGEAVKVPLSGMDADLDAMAGQITESTRLVFVNNPINPTGSMVTGRQFDAFMERVPPGVLVVVDEAYIEFSRDPDCLVSHTYAVQGLPVVTLRTFSKAYGLAGLRLGYGIMPKEVAQILQRIRLPFNANLLAQAGALAALSDWEHLERTRQVVHEGLDTFYKELGRMGLEFQPSQANFLMIRVPRPADEVFKSLLPLGVIVRSMASYGYPGHIRVSVGRPEENRRCLDALARVLS